MITFINYLAVVFHLKETVVLLSDLLLIHLDIDIKQLHLNRL